MFVYGKYCTFVSCVHPVSAQCCVLHDLQFVNAGQRCKRLLWKRHTPGSKKTPHARGWNAADICTNCVYTTHSPIDGDPIPFLRKAGRRSLPPGSAPHKSGGRRVKSWSEDTHKQTLTLVI